MRVGITYDLQSDYLRQGYEEEETAEFDKRETVEAIEASIKLLGYEVERIGNIKILATLLSEGRRWDLVFNIAEGLYGFGREAQVPALLDAYCIPYTFSDPMVLSITLHKGMTKHIVRDCGLPTPDFIVIEDTAELELLNLPFPLFAKPVAEGTGKGIDTASKITDRQTLIRVCSGLLQRFRQPVLLEEYLPGREFTVGILGTGKKAEAPHAMEILFKTRSVQKTYSYRNKKDYRKAVKYRVATGPIAEACREVALKAWRCLGCRDAGRVDIRLDKKGKPNFMEVNPLAGLNPVDSDLPILCRLSGISYHELIGRIMESALERVDSQKKVEPVEKFGPQKWAESLERVGSQNWICSGELEGSFKRVDSGNRIDSFRQAGPVDQAEESI